MFKRIDEIRPAIHGAIIDTGHQNQCFGGIETKREGQRDQDGDTVGGAKAGKGADDRAENTPSDGKTKCCRRKGDREALS